MTQYIYTPKGFTFHLHFWHSNTTWIAVGYYEDFSNKVQISFQKYIALHFCSKTSVTNDFEKYYLMSVQVENNRFCYCLMWWSKGSVEKPWKQLLQRWGRLANLSPSEKKGLLRRVELCGVYLCPLGHFKQCSSSYVHRLTQNQILNKATITHWAITKPTAPINLYIIYVIIYKLTQDDRLKLAAAVM